MLILKTKNYMWAKTNKPKLPHKLKSKVKKKTRDLPHPHFIEEDTNLGHLSINHSHRAGCCPKQHLTLDARSSLLFTPVHYAAVPSKNPYITAPTTHKFSRG